MLRVRAITTSVYSPGDDLIDFITSHVRETIEDGQILAVTSKIVSLSEGRRVSVNQISKEDLVRQEADQYVGQSDFGCHLTIKEGLLLPSAGIDESNSQSGEYILYPADPFASALGIYQAVRNQLGLKKLGVLLTDSSTTPLRRGVTGVALSYYGFRGVENHVGNNDLFGRPLQMTQINLADALAAAATLTMGEGAECRPLALINYGVHFAEQANNDELKIPPKEDLYWPVLRNLPKFQVRPTCRESLQAPIEK